MMRQLIVACGNTLRGDDGAAWRIAEVLRETLHHPDIELATVQQFLPELAHAVSMAASVIFVDAAAGLAPGKIKLEAIEAQDFPAGNFTHAVSPGALLALTRRLYGTLPGQALQLTVGASSFAFCEELSEPVQRTIPEAIAKILAVVEANIENGTGSREIIA